MAKTVSLPPVRIEPEMLDEVTRVAAETGVSVYELTRQAVAEHIRRHGVKAEWTQATQLDDHKPMGVIPS